MSTLNPNLIIHTPKQREAILKLTKDIEAWIRGALEEEHPAFSASGVRRNTGDFYRNFETFLLGRSRKLPGTFRNLLDAMKLAIERGLERKLSAHTTSWRFQDITAMRSENGRPYLPPCEKFVYDALQASSYRANNQENTSAILYMAVIELLAPLASFVQQNARLFTEPKLEMLQRLHELFNFGIDLISNEPSPLTDTACAVVAITSPSHHLHHQAFRRLQDGLHGCHKFFGHPTIERIFVDQAHTLRALQKNGYDTQYAMQGLHDVYQEIAGTYTGKSNDVAMYFDAFIATYAPRGSLPATAAIENFDRNFKILFNKPCNPSILNNSINHFFSPWLDPRRVETPTLYPLNADFANVLIAHSEALGGSLVKPKRPITKEQSTPEAPTNTAGD